MTSHLMLKVFFGCLSVSMVYLAISTSFQSDLMTALERLNQEPWFRTTIIDFYFNIAIISAWVLYKEQKLMHAILWIISFICLGSITTALYVFVQLMLLKNTASLEHVLLRKKE